MTGELQELRAALEKLPEDAGVILEDEMGVKWELCRSFAIGWSTPDPGLVLKIRPWRGR